MLLQEQRIEAICAKLITLQLREIANRQYSELACNRGSCGGIFSNANIFDDIPPHEPRLQASSIPTVRIRILSIRDLRVNVACVA